MVWRVIMNVDRDIIHPLVIKWREEEAAKKTGGGGLTAGGAIAALLLVCLLCSSCAYLKQGVGVLDDYLNDTQSTNTPVPVVTNLPAPPILPPATTVTYIPGDLRDKGADMAMLGFGGFADVRYSANDIQNLRRQSPSIPAKGSWYPLDPVVVSGLSLQIQPDGSILCQASDFTSARTGLRYRFCGYLIQVSTGALVTTNPYTIPSANCAKTLRVMYATVAK